jgi:hypothetical protein
MPLLDRDDVRSHALGLRLARTGGNARELPRADATTRRAVYERAKRRRVRLRSLHRRVGRCVRRAFLESNGRRRVPTMIVRRVTSRRARSRARDHRDRACPR